jgi:Nucleotide modification associated domain 3
LVRWRRELESDMRIVLSRKGFDSASGGCPSPIFPDGRMLSLPIPDVQSPTRYQEIKWNDYNLGTIVLELTDGRIQPSDFAHLDPDLDRESLHRGEGWLPALGQTNAAQGHLRNRGVCAGDVFLFFGLFREIDIWDGRLIWKRDAKRIHVIWGWLQVGEVVAVDRCDKTRYPWATRHPHFHRGPEPNNTLYVARDKMDWDSVKDGGPGAGVFTQFSSRLQLTDPGFDSPSQWRLPAWFYPDSGKTPLSYHNDLTRWQKESQCAKLKAVDRGQEFVLDCDYYPAAKGWLREVLGAA